MKQKKRLKEEEEIFHYVATIVQRFYRGFRSRKYNHNYYARKIYLQRIAEKGREIQEQLNKHLEIQIRVNRTALSLHAIK